MKAIADAPLQSIKGGVQKVLVLVLYQMERLFINGKKYNFDNLSQSDIEALIDKLQKNILIKFCTTGKEEF
jgi:DNA topoisomerase-1